MIIDALVFHCAPGTAHFFQKPLCHFFRQKIPFPYIFRCLTAPVVKHPADDMHSSLLVLLLQCPHILVFMLCRYPDSRLHIAGQALSGQGIQPISRYIQLSCFQIPFHHEKGMKLLLIFRHLSPCPSFGQFLSRGLKKRLLQVILHGLADFRSHRRVLVHLFCLCLPLEGQRHGRGHIQPDFPDCNKTGTNLCQNFHHSPNVPLVFQTFPFCLSNQGMVRVVHQGA